MSMTERDYFRKRSEVMSNLDAVEETEKRYARLLLNILADTVEDMFLDFTQSALELLPFWRNYPPEQRGNKASGTAHPMLELGEKLTSSHLVKNIAEELDDVTFPGLPTGGDVRFATRDALIHLDIKVNGPNDDPSVLVVPPNQVSGDGQGWQGDGILNSTFPITYATGTQKGKLNYRFQPKLPPFYILGDRVLLCLTYYMKVIYTVTDLGIQPLKYFELACVPNGLLMFQGPTVARRPGLIIAGKDEKSKLDSTKRIRIKLAPLAQMHPWRAIKIERQENGWIFYSRSEPGRAISDLFK